jgi:hypothetical protein
MKMCLTLALVLLASVAVAAEQTNPVISDVALQENGVLKGQILNTTGIPQTKSQVAMIKDGKVIATAMTDTNGEFAVAGVIPGVYQIESPHAGGVYRVWAQRTAPPAAKSGVLMVGDTNVVRANLFDPAYRQALNGAIAGAAIATGVGYALDYNKSGS